MYTILVCDDDKDIVAALEIYLRAEGYDVICAYDGQQALDAVQDQEIHLVLMDIMMPVLDGLRATMRLREQGNLPIILTTAKSEDSDVILGLNMGADDYVTKPFNPVALLARVRAQLRRYAQLGGLQRNASTLLCGDIAIDDEKKSVSVRGEEKMLTPIEYSILLLLVRNKGRVYSTAQIYESVWNEQALGADATVAVHIRHIREKLEIDPKCPRHIKVVWGHGYKAEE